MQKLTFGKAKRLLLGGKPCRKLLVLLEKLVVNTDPVSIQLLQENKNQHKTKHLKIQPNYYVVGLNLGGYTQWVR